MLRDTIIRGSGSDMIWRGAWVDGSAYVVNDLVENEGSSYIATQDHMSSPATEPGVGGSWETVWDLVASKGEDGVYDRCDELILEMEMEFKTSYLCYYKELTYNAQNILIDLDIYTDSTANIKLFHKDFTYNVQKLLVQIDLTRISDGALLTSILTYDGKKNLISIERSGYCLCISP